MENKQYMDNEQYMKKWEAMSVSSISLFLDYWLNLPNPAIFSRHDNDGDILQFVFGG